MFIRSIRHTGPSEVELHFCKCYDTILFGIFRSVVLFYGSEDLHLFTGLWSCLVYTVYESCHFCGVDCLEKTASNSPVQVS